MFSLIELKSEYIYSHTCISLVATKPHSTQTLVSQNVLQQEKPGFFGRVVEPGARKIQDEHGVPCSTRKKYLTHTLTHSCPGGREISQMDEFPVVISEII